MERGGSYLYPTIQFPEVETGTISIDLSFNSDILLEDDNGTYGWGYLLDETSAGQGNGPQRYISLEEDSQGPDHQYESIPIVDTHVIETWYNSTRNHLISEDGLSTFTMEDESLIALDTIHIFRDNSLEKEFDLRIIYNAIVTEDGDYLIEEASSSGNNYIKVEDDYGVQDNNQNTIEFDLVETTHWHLRMEDTSHIVYEDETRMMSEEDYFKAPLVEVETEHYDTLGYHLRMENEEYLQHEDGTMAMIEKSSIADDNHIEEIKFDLVDYSGILNLLAMEDGVRILNEDGSRFQSENEISENYQQVEQQIHFFESTGQHLKFEDDDHIISETSGAGFDLERLVLDDLEFKQPDITKIYTTSDAPSDMQRWSPHNHKNDSIETWKDTIVTRTYGMQPFRPHYVSQWEDANLYWVDDKFKQEDDTGQILLEHPVTDQDFLLFEDAPDVLNDMLNLQAEVLDFILLEDSLQTAGTIDGNQYDYIKFEEFTITGIGQGTTRALLETSFPPAEGFEVEATPHQAYTVLPAYRYSRILTRLRGTVTIADGAVAVTGSGSEFTTQLKVGEEFQTANENIITEDTGGGILLETDERIEHEEIRIFHVQSEQLTAADFMGMEIRHFRWLITTEDTTVAAHGSHTGVIGAYSVWDTSLESYWLVGADSNADKGAATETNTAGYPGQIEREAPKWENNNMLWEDGSMQLITEPQQFMVKTITNDLSLTVTRKCMPGGVSDSVYQL